MRIDKESNEQYLELLDVTMAYSEEQLAAVERQIPMTQEIYEECLDICIRLSAQHELFRLMREYPEFLKAAGEHFLEEASIRQDSLNTDKRR